MEWFLHKQSIQAKPFQHQPHISEKQENDGNKSRPADILSTYYWSITCKCLYTSIWNMLSYWKKANKWIITGHFPRIRCCLLQTRQTYKLSHGVFLLPLFFFLNDFSSKFHEERVTSSWLVQLSFTWRGTLEPYILIVAQWIISSSFTSRKELGDCTMINILI